ncbi:unnamed protein product [Dibothriocephalus latus]|uniref:Uncharacterized protein n=1 Tax=Dibothriocephalus latus TaxID=60516 RepID=A0A3P7P559_DIBLA|nr:unnamed protein product [Dibothriocephalus latus]
MAYGLLQCLDHLLVIYTFLPLRCLVTYLTLVLFVLRSVFGLLIPSIRLVVAPPPPALRSSCFVYSHLKVPYNNF